MTHPIDEAVKAENIAQAIVDKFSWSSNVMRNGRLVRKQTVVAEAIAEAIAAERRLAADLITAQTARIEALVMDLAKERVLRVRGTLDAPGFDACVAAEATLIRSTLKDKQK